MGLGTKGFVSRFERKVCIFFCEKSLQILAEEQNGCRQMGVEKFWSHQGDLS